MKRKGTGKARRGEPTLTASDWAEAALQLIAEKGLGALTVSALAARLGVTKGSFYWHFQGRSDLLAAALARWEQRATTENIRGLEAVEDPRRRLELILTAAAQPPRSRSLYAALARSGGGSRRPAGAEPRRVGADRLPGSLLQQSRFPGGAGQGERRLRLRRVPWSAPARARGACRAAGGLDVLRGRHSIGAGTTRRGEEQPAADVQITVGRTAVYFARCGRMNASMISPAPSSLSVSCNCEYPNSSVSVAATTRRGRARSISLLLLQQLEFRAWQARDVAQLLLQQTPA